jgi:folylpolyglutamate synthase/dihydropteroate synthase
MNTTTRDALRQKIARRGIHYSLNRLTPALTKLNHPEMSLPPVIHIAGTNGKGSVAHYITELLMHHNRRVVTYTSPHIHSYTERFKINGTPITDADFTALFEAIAPADTNNELSEYECLTLMAFVFANNESPDALVLETGLGGRLDATNVVPSSLAVITDLGLDHTDILGPAITDIANEKAGIIKPNSHVITHLDHPLHATETIKEHAKKNSATVHWPPKKTGIHERNRALAVVAVSQFLDLPARTIQPHADTLAPPLGRLTPSIIQDTPCYIDVGHNASAVQGILNTHPTISEWIIGMQKTKDIMAVLTLLIQHKQSIKLCEFDATLGVSQHDLPAHIAPHISQWAMGDPVHPNTLFFGSFYFIDALTASITHVAH